MTVVDLDERRRAAAEPTYDGIACGGCAEAWFTLGPNGAVVLGADGRVTGYAGVPRCLSCGAVAAVPK